MKFGFWTMIEGNNAITVQFQDLVVTNTYLYKVCAFVGEKFQIILLSTFDQCDFFFRT